MKKIHTKCTEEHKIVRGTSYITVNRLIKNTFFTACNAVIASKFHTQTSGGEETTP